jgi:hypothetical protein
MAAATPFGSIAQKTTEESAIFNLSPISVKLLGNHGKYFVAV